MEKILISCAFFFFAPLVAPAQTSADAPAFPDSWAGAWHDTLHIYGARGKVQSVPMWLEIEKIDTSSTGRYTFGLVYGSKEEDWRPYELVPVDPAKGLWRVDEKNGIVMESYQFGPKLLCWFVVNDSRVFCTYEKRENDILFEVYAGQEQAVSATGNTVQGEEEIPEVKTFPFSVFQRAELKRQ